jgi:hypothetical protein
MPVWMRALQVARRSAVENVKAVPHDIIERLNTSRIIAVITSAPLPKTDDWTAAQSFKRDDEVGIPTFIE